ncbi:MAG: hypothetical protein Q8R20_00415 [Nanoarchaeota archaeon]|nr:hypothetical protein [Nanoarchaeota archaeon]
MKDNIKNRTVSDAVLLRVTPRRPAKTGLARGYFRPRIVTSSRHGGTRYSQAKIKKWIQALLFGVLTLPLAALARTRVTERIDDATVRALRGTGTKTSVGSIEDIQGIIQDVVGWFQVFFYTFAVIFILLGAWDYLSSGGEAEKTKSGRNKIIYGLVAIAIAVIAGGVVRLVFNFVEGTPPVR